jgi:serine/threonine protein kinase, bacterial
MADLEAAALLSDRYRIIQPLGSGGFSSTYLAEDTHMPSARRCVIKKMRSFTNDPGVYQLIQERFQREAAILEALGEQNSQIPKLYAYFANQGEFLLVQEWIQGHTLAAKFQQQGVFSAAAVQDILVSLLPVLGFIHSQQIIHRDIKPENIILRQQDGKPVLIDFGAVKEVMGTVVNSQGNTTQSIVIGTPGFMPSEQAIGRPVFASDLYSLGLTAVFLLTGKTSPELDTDPRTGEILWQRHLVQAVSSQALGDQTSLETNSMLARVLDKAIQPHPRDRYLTAWEMLADLQTPIPDHHPSPPHSGPTLAKTTAQSPFAQPQSSPNASVPKTTGIKTQVAAPGLGANSIPAASQPATTSKTIYGFPLAAIAILSVVGVATALGLAFYKPQTSPTVAESTPSPAVASPSLTSSPQPSKVAESPTSASTPTPFVSEPVESTPVPEPSASPSSPVASASESPVAADAPNTFKTGRAVDGQAIEVDLDSVSKNADGTVDFVYTLGTERIQSQANCQAGTWTTFPENKTHVPQSRATRRMLGVVCTNAGDRPRIRQAEIIDPPSNVRKRPNGVIICSLPDRTKINVYGSVGSWYITDACGERGVIHDSQIRFL